MPATKPVDQTTRSEFLTSIAKFEDSLTKRKNLLKNIKQIWRNTNIVDAHIAAALGFIAESKTNVLSQTNQDLLISLASEELAWEKLELHISAGVQKIIIAEAKQQLKSDINAIVKAITDDIDLISSGIIDVISNEESIINQMKETIGVFAEAKSR